MGWPEYILGDTYVLAKKIWESPEAMVILLSVIGAFVGVQMANRVTKRRTTIEYLMHLTWDKDFIAARRCFSSMAERPQSFVRAYELTMAPDAPKPRVPIARARKKDLEEARLQIAQILQILNHSEQIAIGIREGILDEAIYRRWFQSGFVRDWEVSSEMVLRIRRDVRNTLFMEFEELASRWRNEGPLKRSIRYIRIFGRHITISRSR
jgi:hypothetical protein